MDGTAIKASEGFLRSVADQNWKVVGPAGQPDEATPGIATLVLTEVHPNITGGRDLIELRALTGGPVGGMTIVFDPAAGAGTTFATLPEATVAAGDVIVVHINPDVNVTGETVSKSEGTGSGNYAGAWDFRGIAAQIPATNKVIAIVDAGGTIQDAVAFTNGGIQPAGFVNALQYIQALGHWLPADSGGQPTTYASTPSAQDISANWFGTGTTPAADSIRRASGADTNMKGDWSIGASSFGAPN
jgi:hypothetical protein